MSDQQRHVFDDDLEMHDTGNRVFELMVSDHWSINGTPNGGYLMALAAKAMEQCSRKKQTPVITANYISRCLPGPAQAHVEIISESINFSRLMVRFVQDGEEKIRALGTFSSDLDGDAIKKYETGPPDMTSFETSFRVPVMPENRLFDHIDLRLDPSCVGWISGNLSELSVSVRKIPDTPLLRGIFRSRFISAGLVEEDGELWDIRGELVAISRQISKYRK